jgi:hypothetical protein
VRRFIKDNLIPKCLNSAQSASHNQKRPSRAIYYNVLVIRQINTIMVEVEEVWADTTCDGTRRLARQTFAVDRWVSRRRLVRCGAVGAFGHLEQRRTFFGCSTRQVGDETWVSEFFF